MKLSYLDWTIIGFYFLISLGIGLWVSKNSGDNTKSFFLANKNMPWWLLGISMVATTFSTDTPNLVTGIVRQKGVSGNWTWWAFLLTGMITVFVYSKLWYKTGVLTDIEFYELRYSGKSAAFLRGFRALYLGLVFNVLVMGAVSLAAIKFGEIVLNWPSWFTLLIACSITLIYSTLGGLKAVIITDFIQFLIAMIGSIWATIYILDLKLIMLYRLESDIIIKELQEGFLYYQYYFFSISFLKFEVKLIISLLFSARAFLQSTIPLPVVSLSFLINSILLIFTYTFIRCLNIFCS